MTIDEQIRRNIEEEPIFIPYIGNDAPVHTWDHPFCDDVMCPCHSDLELLQTGFMQPYMDGLFTVEEAVRTFYGRQL